MYLCWVLQSVAAQSSSLWQIYCYSQPQGFPKGLAAPTHCRRGVLKLTSLLFPAKLILCNGMSTSQGCSGQEKSKWDPGKQSQQPIALMLYVFDSTAEMK